MLGAPIPGKLSAESEQLLEGRLRLSVFWAAKIPHCSATDRNLPNGDARGLLTLHNQILGYEHDLRPVKANVFAAPDSTRGPPFEDPACRVALLVV